MMRFRTLAFLLIFAPAVHAQSTAPDASLDAAFTLAKPVERLHALCLWVQNKDKEALLAAARSLPVERKNDPHWMQALSARLQELNARPEEMLALWMEFQAQKKSDQPLQHSDGSGLPEEFLALAAEDPQRALDWINDQVMHPEEADAIRTRYFTQLARNNPLQAAQTMKNRRDLNRPAILKLIANEWASQDPRSAIAWTKTLPSSPHAGDLQAAIADVWETSDPAATMEAIAELPQTPETYGILKKLMEKWAEDHPDRALEWLQKDHLDPHQTASLVQTLAKTKPAAAAKMMDKLPAFLRSGAAATIASEWIQRDYQQCAAWLASLPLSGMQMDAMQAACEGLMKSDPAQAMRLLENMPSNRVPSGTINGILSSMEPAAAMAWLSGRPPEKIPHRAWSSVLQKIAREDPRAALAKVTAVPAGVHRTEAIAGIAKQWIGSDDRAAAVAWISGIKEQETLSAVLQSVGTEWAKEDPAGAAAFAFRLPPGETLDRFSRTVAIRYAAHAPRDAVRWAAQLPSFKETAEAVRICYQEFAGKHGGEIENALRALPPGSSRDAAVLGSLSTIQKEKPAEAGRLILSYMQEEKQVQAAGELIKTWSRSEPAAALEWTIKLPPGKVRDQAAGRIAAEITATDPAKAMQMATMISDEKQRADASAKVIDKWWRKDPAAAETALQQAPIPEVTREELLQKLRARNTQQ